MVPDAQLLHRYVAFRDQPAFAELVQRHLGLVYASALRRTGGRAHLAQEIAQSVFTDLARKAATLQHHPALAAWLHRSTRYAAIAAIREEARRLKLAQAAAMMEFSANDEPAAEWERLRPFIDDSIDQLKESDRTVVLLRHFEGLSFAEIGARLALSENTARVRADRALEKLRRHLQSRGVISTSAALALTLSNSALASAPAGLFASVTAGALSSTSVTATSGLATILLMSKFTAPAVSAIAASVSALLLWTSLAPQTDARELASLRAENARLVQALAADAPASALANVAENIESSILAATRAVEQQSTRASRARPSSNALQGNDSREAAAARAATQHRNRGQATPHDAFMSMAWASDGGEVETLSNLLWFDSDVRPKAEAVLASMPASLRQTYNTPEKLFALIYAADAIVAPPPGPDLIERWNVVELAQNRVALRAPGSKPHVDYHQYQQTGDGWKYVVPEVAVENMPAILTNETLGQGAQP